MRENMSRPSWSRPNQCAADGPSQRCPISSFGSCGAIHGASAEVPTQTRMIRMPIAAVMVSLPPNSFMSPSPRMPQTRIAEDRQDVRRHVQTDEHDGENQTAGLHDRNIALGDRVDHQ